MKSAVLGFAVVVGALTWAGSVERAHAADLTKIVEGCAGCHGKDGASTESDVPIIAGFSQTYLEYNLTLYAKKERPCPDVKIKAGAKKGSTTNMCEVAKELGDSDVTPVAKYFSGKKFVRASQAFDPELAKQGKAIHQQNCEKCHSSDGSDPKDDAGILAGQWMPYLKTTFDEFAAGTRPMEQKMKPKIKKLDKAGFEALANYFASFK